MSEIAVIIPDTVSVIQAARMAARQGCGLYIMPDGTPVIAPQALPGWQRIGVMLKNVRDDYEQTDATADCCDIRRAA